MSTTYGPPAPATYGPPAPAPVGPQPPPAPALKAKPVYGPPAPKKPAPVAKPQPSAPQPNLAEQPNGPPVPLLQKLTGGIPMSIQTFGNRLQAVESAYVAQHGVKPDPTTALSAALVTPPTEAPKLFQTPNLNTAKAKAALAVFPSQTDAQFVKSFSAALNSGDAAYQQFVNQNESRIHDLQSGGPFKAQVNGIVNNAAFLKASGVNLAPAGTKEHQVTPVEEGLAPTALAKKGLSGIDKVLSPVGLGISQVVGSLVHSPGGIYTMLDTEYNADKWAVEHPVSIEHPLRKEPNPYLAKESQMVGGMVKSTKADFEKPGQNPGFLFLDILGLASLAGGTAARVGAAGRAVGEGEGAVGAVKALGAPPTLQRHTLTVGGYSEEMPLSSNPFVASVQKVVLNARQARANALLDGGPAPVSSVLLPQAARQFLDEHLSFTTKVGREAEARLRVEHTAQMALANELQHAAGAATTTSRALGRIVTTEKSGLTRGEQKAIQALSWDDPDPLEAEKNFHESMIEQGIGSASAHKTQIADLALAKKAIADDRPRFRHAVDLTAQVIAEQQRMKIEQLGLSPLTAEGRVAKAAQVLREEPPVGGATVTDTGQYLPTQPRGKVKRQPSQAKGRFGVSAGPYGVPLGRDMPELTHEFTGSALRAGDFRIDATNLAAEAYARTVRAVSIKNQWSKLWEAASDGQRTDWDIPIRDANTIPDKLREVVAKLDEGVFNQSDADMLPKDMQDMIRALYPDSRDLTTEDIPHVKWIDSRLVGQLGPPHVAGWPARIASAINSPFRFAALYLRPAYALNLLGNASMMVFDQGFLNSIETTARAMALEKTDGARSASTIRALVGAGKSKSYVTGSAGKVSRAVAEFWNRFADRDERVASWLYYADRKGYKTPADRAALLADEDKKGDLAEVTRRANKSLVEFDNLTPLEKNTLRHIIFVYPWVRGSAVWSLRAIMEHPAKTDLLAHLGQQEIQNDPLLSSAPEWFKQAGYFPIGWNGDGTPKVVNLSSLNTFSTFGQFLGVIRDLAVGDNANSVASDLLGPAVTVAIQTATGRDEYGNQFPGGAGIGALKALFQQLPQLQRFETKKTHPVTPFDIRKRDSLQSHLDSLAKQSVFGPGWADGLGSLVTGGLTPKTVNVAGLEARGVAEEPAPQRVARELKLLNFALTRQGEFLGTPVPKTLRDSVRDQANITLAYAAFAKKMGRTPTAKEKASIVLTYLASKGRIAPNEPVFSQEGPQFYAKAYARNKQFAKPGPYQTVLDPTQEKQFEAWVQQNNVPFDTKAKTVDYDMRGYWLATGGKTWSGGTAHFPDTYKTPYDTTFSNQSKYATANNPFVWKGNDLIDNRDGSLVFGKQGATTRDQTVAKLQKQLMGLSDDNISSFHNALIDKYADGKNLRQWDSDVRALYSFQKPTFNEKAAGLFAQDLSPQRTYQNVPQAKLDEYGRGFLKFQATLRDAKAKKEPAEAIRLIVDEHSNPVDGLPSYAAIAWANQTPAEQKHALLTGSYAGWDTLTAVEKKLLGKPVDPAVTEAWSAYEQLTSPAALAKQLPVGQRSIDAAQRLAVVKQIDRYYGLKGGFTKDYLFSKQPLYQRLPYLDVVKDSPHKSDWNALFAEANTLDTAVKDKRTTKAAADDAWGDYVARLPNYYKTENPAFWRELAPIVAANPKFLKELVN